MGGGGEHYDRDTKDGYAATDRGFSQAAETLMGRRGADPGVLPKGRRVGSNARSPTVLCYDVTGSVDALPMIFADKLPLIAGQIGELRYLDDPEISLSAVGDIGDRAPIQVADFAKIRHLDDWLQRLWREKGGLANGVEAYEFLAYYYAFCCDIPDAVTPFFVFIADEGMRRSLYKSDLERVFGGTHQNIDTVDVFRALDRAFKGNVFLVHRHYGIDDDKALSVWRECLGDDRIVKLGTDRSIADVLLGLFAIVTGARTLDAYLDDMVSARARPQSAHRVAEVRTALTRVSEFAKAWPMARPSEDPVRPIGGALPTPDDLNEQLDAEAAASERAAEVYIANLRSMLMSPTRRPLPSADGWTYCKDLVVPEAVRRGTSEWGLVRDALSDTNWEADLATEPVTKKLTLRIRRIR